MRTADQAPRCRPGDTVTVTGRVRKTYGPGPHMALVETGGGSVWVSLTVDGMLDDPSVVVTPAPNPPARVHEVDGGGCSSCGARS